MDLAQSILTTKPQFKTTIILSLSQATEIKLFNNNNRDKRLKDNSPERIGGFEIYPDHIEIDLD
tara:strand:- start:916 stop:1107 length:192 start_codon:yes stop_codon:yes gene_type:complete